MQQEHLVALVVWVEGEEAKKNILKNLKKELEKANKNVIVKENSVVGILKALATAGVNATTILADISSITSPDNPLFQAVNGFFVLP